MLFLHILSVYTQEVKLDQRLLLPVSAPENGWEAFPPSCRRTRGAGNEVSESSAQEAENGGR